MFKLPARSLLCGTPERDPATGKINYVLSEEDLEAYAFCIDAKRHPYFCAATGVLARSIWHVIRISVQDYCKRHIVHSWCRTCAWQK